MSLNYSVVNGKLPHFDPNYKEGNGDKKSVWNYLEILKKILINIILKT